MSQFQEGPLLSFLAGADLSAKQYTVVKHGTNKETIVNSSAATDKHIGVLQNKPKSGQEASVRPFNAQGTGKVKLGGNVTKGAYLTADSAGEAVATTAQGDIVFGIAHEAGSDGDIIEYLPIFMIIPEVEEVA
jgi:hypothetical protein